MAVSNVFGINPAAETPLSDAPSLFSRVLSALARRLTRLWCGIHGHLVLLHFEPNKLSLQCALCGYESEGWEVGRPPAPRRPIEHRVHARHVHVERRRTLHAVPSAGTARMAS